jgi:glycosyltransferase involved in cell wall biosynthesis
MPDPRISVIIPIFNVAEYLDDCLGSVLRQTFGKGEKTRGETFEVILVDDGSTDDSRRMAAAFAALHQGKREPFTVTLLCKSNGGASHARRDGVAIAKGRWLAFVDSDDWLHPEYLELLYLKAKDTKSDVVACGLVRTTGDHAEIRVIPPVSTRPATNPASPNCFDINTYPLLWNKLWSKQIIDRWISLGGEFPGANVSLGEDIALTYVWIALCNSVTWIPDGLYFYRIRSGSAVSERWTNPRHRRSIHLAIRHMLQEASKVGVLESHRDQLARVSVLHLIRSNAQEIKSAMTGDSDAEAYCIEALSVLNKWFPDWPETTAENDEERQIFLSLRDALVWR